MGKLLILMMVVSNLNCSLLVKQAVNKKYPPVSNHQITNEAIIASLAELKELDTASVGISITNELLNTTFKTLLDSSVNQFRQNQNLKIKLLQHEKTNFILGRQEMILNTRISAGFKKNSKFGKLKLLNFSIEARCRPIFSQNNLYIYPSYTRFRIHKLRGRGFLPFLFAKPAKILINKLAELLMDNINGQTKDFKFTIESNFIDSTAISKILKSNEAVSVIKDDTMKLTLGVQTGLLFIEPSSINILSKIRFNNSTYISRSMLSQSFRNDNLYNTLSNNFDSTWEKWLGKRMTGRTGVMINGDFLDTALNKMFSNLNFGVQVDKSSKKFIEPKEIKFIKNVDCNNIGNMFKCPILAANNCPHIRIWTPWGKISVPEPHCWNAKNSLCEGEILAKLVYCKTDLKGILDAMNIIGLFSGSVQLKASPQIYIGGINFSTRTFSTKVKLLSNNSSVGINLKYDPIGPGTLLLCPLPVRKDLDFSVKLDQDITISAKFDKYIDENKKLNFIVNFNEFQVKLGFSPSIAEMLIRNPDLVINCNLPISILGQTSFLALGSSKLFCNGDKGEVCSITRAVADIFFGQLYTHSFNGLKIEKELSAPKIKTKFLSSDTEPTVNDKAIGFYLLLGN